MTESGIFRIPNPKHQRFQLAERQTELLGEHNGFRFFLGRDVQRVVPVGKVDADEAVSAPVVQQPPHRGLYMLENRRFAAILPLDGQGEDAFVAGLFEKLAYRPDDPKGLVGIAGVVVGVPGQHRVAVPELVAQAFEDLRFGFLRSVI